jgi:hypothetical protein
MSRPECFLGIPAALFVLSIQCPDSQQQASMIQLLLQMVRMVIAGLFGQLKRT